MSKTHVPYPHHSLIPLGLLFPHPSLVQERIFVHPWCLAMPKTMFDFFQELIFVHPFSLLSLLLFVTFIYKLWVSPNSITKTKNTPPSPPRFPIIGNLHQLGTYPYRTLQTLSRKYGDLILLHLGSKPAIVVSSAETASQVLKTHDLVFANRPNLSVFKRLLGKDILSSSYGEYWRQMRSICVLQLLSSKRVRSFRSVREEELALMMKNIKGLSMVNLSDMFVSLSMDVISRIAFGKKCSEEKGSRIQFYELVDELMKLLGGYYIGDFIPWLAWVDWIIGVDAKVSKVNSGFDDFFERIIKEHSSRGGERKHGDKEENEMVIRDLVDVLLEAQVDDGSGNSWLDNESIKAVIRDMFAAGSDTSYVTLEWIMSELLRNPRVMRELQKEVRGIVGNKEMVTEDDLENMKYLKVVIKETFRLHPPAPLLAPHESTEDVTINGFEIAAGTLVMINVWSISRDPAYWEEPESFYPERFLNSGIDFNGQDFRFIPFGSGRRMCPGMAFAMANIELVLANLVHQFDWALPKDVDGGCLDMREAPGITIHRKTPLLAIPMPRS